MKLNEILTISGYSGLFKIIAKGRNNIIVESLTDGKRMPAFATDRISSLADIALFTTGEDLPLSQVFKRMFEAFDKKEVALNFKKQTKEMLEYFEKAIPEYDKERVYTSDIKKIMTWYNQLVKNNLLPFEEEVKENKEPLNENKQEHDIKQIEKSKANEDKQKESC